ncbi:tRNA epoxyqueuosine(34) reductase QueG [Rhabdaerophilum sp.]|uniref:tRNA epoxyqueuosine(34) reductase QueG n=1 Tax=Rhabdaerophilum sp. TaxID=2717341 RepID=UPI0038D4000A
MLPELVVKHGFSTFGIAPAKAPPEREARLRHWLSIGAQGEMEWMAREPEKRASPAGLWPEAQGVIMLGLNHAPEFDPLALLENREAGALAAYAVRRDYHDVIKGRLKALAVDFVARTGAAVKVFVDTAPVLEKPLAAEAGLGWQGKHTVLVSREFGNWLFLGAIYTTLPLEPDPPEKDHCGSCRRCIDICPTDAFPAPYQVDARRCIAYLTIEHKGAIAREFRAKIGNRIFGCDDCIAVCPWNKFAQGARDARLATRKDLLHKPLVEYAMLDDAGFRALFAGTPIKRTGRDRFLRNVLIGIGNSGNPALAASAEPHLDDPHPLVRGAAVWALSRLLAAEAFADLARRRAPAETDEPVREEWELALMELPLAETTSGTA